MEETEDSSALTPALTGRTALVTGAGSGIGLAIARALRGAGARVLVNDVSAERAETAADSIGAEPFPGDITDPAFAARSAEEPVDILVNNAGFQHVAPLER